MENLQAILFVSFQMIEHMMYNMVHAVIKETIKFIKFLSFKIWNLFITFLTDVQVNIKTASISSTYIFIWMILVLNALGHFLQQTMESHHVMV